MQEHVCLTEAFEQKQAAVACRNAIFLTDPHVDRESVISAKGTRVAGTCEWITHNKSYRTWLNSDGNGGTPCLLWISGGPGKGKTMLSVFLTEELERHSALRQRRASILLLQRRGREAQHGYSCAPWACILNYHQASAAGQTRAAVL